MAARSDRPDERPDEHPDEHSDERPDERSGARADGPSDAPSDAAPRGRSVVPGAADGTTNDADPLAEPLADPLPGPLADPSAPVADDDWARIVAQLGDVDSAAETAARSGLDFPVAPGVDSPFDRAHVVRPASGQEARDPLASAGGRDWDGTSQYDDAEDEIDEQDAFVPPDPGPVLGGDPLLTMAWFAAAGMPLLLLAVLIFWRDAPPALVQAACIVFVVGVAVLVWRMPQRRERQDDDGAVV